MIPSVRPKELATLIDTNPNDIEIIDVRSTQEYEEVRIIHSKNIPLHILPLRMHDIDTKKKIIFICRSGGRSAQATLFTAHSHTPSFNLHGWINEFENDYPEHVERKEMSNFFNF